MRHTISSILFPLKITAIIILFSVASACATTPDEIKLLDKSFMLYEHALRWQDYDLVIGFHKPEQETLTDSKRKQLKEYRVTGYNVVYTKIEPDNKSAKQVIEIKYYNDAYAVVRDITVTHNWEYDDEKIRWQINNPLPEFR